MNIFKNNDDKIKLSLKILVFILVVIASFSLGYFLSNLGNTNKKDIITEKNLNDVIESDWITPKGTKGEVAIYQSLDTKALIISNDDESLKDENLYKKKYTYKCNDADCVGISLYEDLNYVVIKDKDYVIYDYYNNRYKKINIEEDISFENIILLNYNKEVYGYALVDENNKVAIYNDEKEKLITDFEYNNIYYDENPELYDENIIVSNDEKTYILNFNNGKVKKEFITINEVDSEYFYRIEAVGNGKHVYYLKNYGLESNDYEIFNNNFEGILGDNRFSQVSVLPNGNLIVSNSENKFYEYKEDGSLVRESKDYKSIVVIDNGYIVIIDNDDYLKVINNKGKELVKFLKIADNHYVHSMLSGWYTIDKKEGLYVVIEDQYVEENTKGRIIKYYYEPENDKSGKLELTRLENEKDL